MNEVTTTEHGRKSVLVDMANRYGMEPKVFADTLRATVVPKEATNEQFAAFVLVAKHYGLNPILKEIFAFPTKGGGIQPIVSIDGWANLINSHPAMDGMEFVDEQSDKGELLSITCRIYRKDRAHPVATTEYMVECVRNTDTWRQWPRRMLRHKAMIQAARYAFGFAGIIDPDEWDRSPEKADETVKAPPAPPAPIAMVIETEPKPEPTAEPDSTDGRPPVTWFEQLEAAMQDGDVAQVWADFDVDRICADTEDRDVALAIARRFDANWQTEEA